MIARVIQWMASSVQDLRHGIVLVRRDASVSALIVLVLVLGIGGNAAIFTLLKAAFLDPLPCSSCVKPSWAVNVRCSGCCWEALRFCCSLRARIRRSFFWLDPFAGQGKSRFERHWGPAGHV